MIGIGKNDRDENYVPSQVMIPQLINTIRETDASIKVVHAFLGELLPEVIRKKYEQKLTNLTDSRFKYIYSIIELIDDIKSNPCGTKLAELFNAELAELIGDNISSNINKSL